MDIRLGYTIDLGGRWGKMDIGVDEADIKAFLFEHGFDPETQFTVQEKYKILTLTAEKFLLVNQIQGYKELDNEDTRGALAKKVAEIRKLAQDLRVKRV